MFMRHVILRSHETISGNINYLHLLSKAFEIQSNSNFYFTLC